MVVTGVGLITALGIGWAANAQGFRVGRPAFRPVTLFDVSRQRARLAGEVDLPATAPPTRLNARHVRRIGRGGRLLLWAAAEAWRQSGWEGDTDLPMVLGTTGGGTSLGQDYYRQAVGRPTRGRGQASRVAHYQPQRQGQDLCDAFGCRGPVTLIANACASGANAIGHAWHLLRAGVAERALAGGYDELSQLVYSGFDALQALSPTRCRPFDAGRDGLALGEGAAVLALETLSGAQGRGAAILAELVGYGATTDVHHLTQPQPQGDAAYAAMRAACQCAGLAPGQVDYLNAHGTGTPLNDSAEAEAIQRWAGASVTRLRVSSTKAVIGHLLGAAGAVEAAVCVMVLREQWLPPQTTVERLDPRCRFSLVTEATSTQVEVALSNSFGFGGANATLAFRRWP